MQAKIGKWNDSLAVSIPSSIAERHGITLDSTVELSSVDEKLVITLVGESDTRLLDTLLAGVSDANLHDEVETGPSVGGEAW